MLARRQLRLAAQDALTAAKLGAVIDAPGDWVTQPEKMPAVLMRATRGSKVPMTAGPAQFTTTVTVELESRVVASTAPAAQDAIDALDQLVEVALFTNPQFVGITQRIYVETETEVTAEGRNHFGATKWAIRCECVDAFDPIWDAPEALQPVGAPLEGMDLHADLVNVYDATGTYLSAAFPGAAAPAPRTAGPDGRDEGGLSINLQQ